MARQAVRGIGWMLTGMVLMGAIVWILMPSMMLVVHESPLGYQETVNALNKVIESRPDWKVPVTYDFQQTIHDAGHGPIEQVGTVALCNPRYASRILSADDNKKVTAFMPLGVGVYQDKDGTVYISELNVALVGLMFGGTVAEVMADAGEDVSEIISLAIAGP
jgi:uncharacterized protein (DUF302 family)